MAENRLKDWVERVEKTHTTARADKARHVLKVVHVFRRLGFWHSTGDLQITCFSAGRNLMRKLLLVAWLAGSIAQADVAFADESSTIAAAPLATRAKRKVDVSKIYGKIMYVDSFPDYKVQIVNSFPNLKVQVVKSFPDKPGKWKIVNSFPDYKIQLVNSFPDFTVQYVTSFPGVP